MNNRNQKNIEKPIPGKEPKSSLKRVFWWLAGAEPWVLEDKDCATAHQLMAAIGAVVLFTGVIGGLAGGFAVNRAFNSTEAAILFGSLWGIVILNLDRYMVMSIKKVRGQYGLQLIAAALPRLLMALLISLSVAVPLEVKLFENDLKATNASRHRAFVKAEREKIFAEYTEIEVLEKQKEGIRAVVREKEEERSQFYDQAIGEAEGRIGSGQKGFGPLYERKQTQLQIIDGELANIRKKNQATLDELDQHIKTLRNERDQRLAELEKASGETQGLLSDLAALSALSAKDANVKYAGWIFRLLIFVLDAAPILVKLLTPRIAYDIVFQSLEADVRKKYGDADTKEQDEDILAAAA